ncbi:MAG: hypothetical protein A2934_02990 [Candidatus Sungbacteria bacterium RIFCSPLOWO2_01_FULL_47_10]|uniref:Uncharacterized protein n=1 Tax=Candidatus Sungbacteria bacterium RIFCSPLOWO2_01_FULL_47_10 TaxID=1802276 RepID=A0A1G2LAF7_9BACT|nr:MAG: hypothetical protein A2934_02990 [Candidatus Sungbacteria bacterium RIFCSPLOWO2_01_FULL_47_10]
MKAWSREISEELSVIMFERSGFQNPLILATNETVTTSEEAVRLYQAYCRRWSKENHRCFGGIKILLYW